MFMKDEKKNERPEAYPKPSVTDNQLQNQPEYVDQQPNSFDNEVGDMPAVPSPAPDKRATSEEEM
jgi:hypothetical protein